MEVPDRLWAYQEFGNGKKYSDNQAEDMVREDHVMRAFDEWTAYFAAYVARKGKVRPGKHRAFGYQPLSHHLDDLKLKWREVRMSVGAPPKGSSPWEQERLGLNRDATFRPAKSGAERNAG